MGKTRVAIVGCGYWGQNLIRNFSELDDVEVVAVCDFNLNALARMKRRYPTLELKQDYQDILSDARIHGVVIATPVSTHYPFARRALQAGKHVLVGKPLGTTPKEGPGLIEASQKNPKNPRVGQTF